MLPNRQRAPAPVARNGEHFAINRNVIYFAELASGNVGPVLSGSSRRCSIPRTTKRNRRVHGRDWSPLPSLRERGSLGESTSVAVAHGQSTRDTLLPMFPCGRLDSGYRVRGTMVGPSRRINGRSVAPRASFFPARRANYEKEDEKRKKFVNALASDWFAACRGLSDKMHYEATLASPFLTRTSIPQPKTVTFARFRLSLPLAFPARYLS